MDTQQSASQKSVGGKAGLTYTTYEANSWAATFAQTGDSLI